MCRTKLFGLLTWLVVFTWLISACAPPQAPQPTAVETREAEHSHEGKADLDHEAEMAELEPVPSLVITLIAMAWSKSAPSSLPSVQRLSPQPRNWPPW